MSLYLGKIHYWLYNKILWFEGIEEEIINTVRGEYSAIDEFVEGIYNEFGTPTDKKPLEDIIDTSNIHGWLQQRIESAELRQAALITEILKWDSSYKSELIDIYSKSGRISAQEYRSQVNAPEEIFNAINNFILEGMPCDKVYQMYENTDMVFSWKISECLHKPHWLKVSGDVQIFYDLRDAFIKSFVESVSDDYKFEKSEGLSKIVRKE